MRFPSSVARACFVRLLFVGAVVSCFAYSFTVHHVAAQSGFEVSGPITAEQCLAVNPNPTVTTCDSFPNPSPNLYTNLPWADPDYATCVVQRCNCTKAADISSPGYAPNGLHCQASGTWEESGFVTCDAMLQCFQTFWRCATQICWSRYLSQGIDALTSGEQAYIQAILKHAQSFGQPFSETEIYASCAAIQCQAAAGRKNCGLITCVPNNTQCIQWIEPLPAPDGFERCSSACQGSILVMAVSIAVLCFSLMCFKSCPPRVRVLNSLLKDQPDSVPHPLTSPVQSDVD